VNNDDVGTIRAGMLIGRTACDRSGNRLGMIADLVTHGDLGSGFDVTHIVITRRPWGRLLGYERMAAGPWLLQTFARLVIRRRVLTIAWEDLGHCE
jgi:hypothetical protein